MKYITIIIFILLFKQGLTANNNIEILDDKKGSKIANIDKNIYNGRYEWHTENTEASLTVKRLDNGKYKIYGIALWGINNTYGPNIGELDFIAKMQKNTISYKEGKYVLSLKFDNGMIIANELGGANLEFGMNVFFDGKYEKVMKKKLEK